MSVPAVLDKLAAIQGGIAGVKRAYSGNAPPDSVEDWPAFVNFYASSGRGAIEYDPQTVRHTYPVAMRLLLTKQDLQEAVTATIALVPAVFAAFWANVALGGLVTRALIEDYQPGRMTYAGEEWYGVEFTLRVVEIFPVAFETGT